MPLSEAKGDQLTLPYTVGVRIVLRVYYGDCRKYTGLAILHESDDTETIGGLGDLPRDGVSVQQ